MKATFLLLALVAVVANFTVREMQSAPLDTCPAGHWAVDDMAIKCLPDRVK